VTKHRRLKFLISPEPWILINTAGLLITVFSNTAFMATLGFGIVIFATFGIFLAGWVYALDREAEAKELVDKAMFIMAKDVKIYSKYQDTPHTDQDRQHR
jgi:hypothetical protein